MPIQRLTLLIIVGESIEEWREADKNPNGIYTNPVTGQQIPNWLAYPNTDWAQILFQPAFYQNMV